MTFGQAGTVRCRDQEAGKYNSAQTTWSAPRFEYTVSW